jgi:polyribonucleotide nucleotidyltransferase
MSKQVFSLDFYGRKLTVEAGELAKQANGAVLVRYEDTAVLSVVAAKQEPSNAGFFPLMVLYNEKLYSVGKIPGGFIKREGRPSENATLTARLIDRPLRPLFPKGFQNDVQVINEVLSVDNDCSPEMSALFGSSLAVSISDIPFNGPVAGVVVGRVDGEYVINPTPEQLKVSDIDLTVAGTKDAINMVEAGAKQVSEADMLGAILYGHEAIKQLVAFQEEIVAAVGKEKFEVIIPEIEATLEEAVRTTGEAKLREVVSIKEKLARQDAIDNVKDEVIATFEEKYADSDELSAIIKDVKKVLDGIVKEEVRRLITEDKVRPDGRKLDEIRPLDSQIDILKRTHGSALFTRGQTQALSVVTLGALAEYQILDGVSIEDRKRFMLHYNFPQYSVGETGRYGPPSRRAIGHGALGERAIAQVIPSEDDFPYTIRVVSEILESNGSTSQASICAGTMALMAAGVPLKSPVAGIAMGLVTKEENYSILSDIQGLEDFLGDMDFKVAGTKDGITALQMDIKIAGLTKEILEEALEQARVGRLHILENMMGAIKEPRVQVSEHAPKLKKFYIKPDKIRDVIGPGGKIITQIIEDSNDVKIDIEDDGLVIIYHSNYEDIETAYNLISEIVREVEVGKVYTGKVVRIEKFGCFVELWPGQSGMVHISQLAPERVEKVEDVVSIGDEIIVKATKIDDRGRVDLSRKAAISE